jgi:hypothetical protein
MSPLVVAALVVAPIGALLLIGCALLIRWSGAQVGMARRLGGAPGVRVGELFDVDQLPERPLRVAGRARCNDPMITEKDERLVAFHRDVEVEAGPGEWRRIQRLRGTPSGELGDHDGSARVDPALAAEPLVAIPHVWIGAPDELDETFQPAIARLAATHGKPRRARAETRMLSVVDRLLVLGTVRREGGRPTLAPPSGGFVMSNLELDEAMRLLGGPHRRWLPFAIGGAGIGVGLLVIGLLLAAVGLVLAP